MLYGYIRDKDIFERDYQQYLASRLLQDLSSSEQSERSMIGKLKNNNYHWTSKLEDMFIDVHKSKELTIKFRNRQEMLRNNELLIFGFIRMIDKQFKKQNKYIPSSIFCLCFPLYQSLWEVHK
eukprot:218284_1